MVQWWFLNRPAVRRDLQAALELFSFSRRSDARCRKQALRGCGVSISIEFGIGCTTAFGAIDLKRFRFGMRTGAVALRCSNDAEPVVAADSHRRASPAGSCR